MVEGSGTAGSVEKPCGNRHLIYSRWMQASPQPPAHLLLLWPVSATHHTVPGGGDDCPPPCQRGGGGTRGAHAPHRELNALLGLSSTAWSRANAAHLPAQYLQPARRPWSYMTAGTCCALSARSEPQAVNHRVVTSLLLMY